MSQQNVPYNLTTLPVNAAQPAKAPLNEWAARRALRDLLVAAHKTADKTRSALSSAIDAVDVAKEDADELGDPDMMAGLDTVVSAFAAAVASFDAAIGKLDAAQDLLVALSDARDARESLDDARRRLAGLSDEDEDAGDD